MNPFYEYGLLIFRISFKLEIISDTLICAEIVLNKLVSIQNIYICIFF